MKTKWFFKLLQCNTGLNKIKTAFLVYMIFCTKNFCVADNNDVAETDAGKLLEKNITASNAVVDDKQQKPDKTEAKDKAIKSDLIKLNEADLLKQEVVRQEGKSITAGTGSTTVIANEIATAQDGVLQTDGQDDKTTPVVMTSGLADYIADKNIAPVILSENDKNRLIKDNNGETVEQKKNLNISTVDSSVKQFVKIEDVGKDKKVDSESNMTKLLPVDTKDIVIDEKVLKKVDQQISDIDKEQEQEIRHVDAKKNTQTGTKFGEQVKEGAELSVINNNFGEENHMDVGKPVALEDLTAPSREHTKKKSPEQLHEQEYNNDKEKVQKTDKTKKITGIDFERLFTTFKVKKALNYDYNSVKFDNFGFLENANEIKLIKRTIIEQKNPKLKKEREERERQSTLLQSQQKEFKAAFQSSAGDKMRVASLVYFDDNNWRARIGRRVISNKDKTLNNVAVVKVNKTSIAFVLKKTSSQLVEQVKKIREEGGSYSKNYYLIPDGHRTYIAFKLFIGQKIDLNTLKISG